MVSCEEELDDEELEPIDELEPLVPPDVADPPELEEEEPSLVLALVPKRPDEEADDDDDDIEEEDDDEEDDVERPNMEPPLSLLVPPFLDRVPGHRSADTGVQLCEQCTRAGHIFKFPCSCMQHVAACIHARDSTNRHPRLAHQGGHKALPLSKRRECVFSEECIRAWVGLPT
jgi:hypothetical protein